MLQYAYQMSRFMFAFAALCLAACGGGGNSNAGGGDNQGGANHAPVAAYDVVRADDAALSSINVLANDSDQDGGQLSVTIEQAPTVGTATVNADGTVKLESLPAGFKGVIRFAYRVTDPSGMSAVSAAAVFVGADPFQVVLAGDATGSGAVELHLADFVSTPRALTTATEGNLRLRGFAASDNGTTVVYAREDTTSSATADLSFVQTANAAQQVRIALPSGTAPSLDAEGNDQFIVSPDGQWIAMVAGDASTRAMYVLNVADSAVIKASPASAVYAERPRFALNSGALYFLASDVAGGVNQSLYVVALSDPATPVRVSAAPSISTDTVADFSVAADQSRILLQANRAGNIGLYFVDPSQLQIETRVNHQLSAGETIAASTVGLALGSGGSAQGERVAYTTQKQLTFRSYVAEVSGNSNSRSIGPTGAIVIGFRPDGSALLYSRNGEIYEAVIDSQEADKLIGDGDFGWYDSTGNIVLLEQSLPSGGSPSLYPALAASARETFGTTQQLGTAGLAAHFINTSGVDRGVAIMGEGATTGSAPTRARLTLVNAMAPQSLLQLADFESPLDMTTDAARVVASAAVN